VIDNRTTKTIKGKTILEWVLKDGTVEVGHETDPDGTFFFWDEGYKNLTVRYESDIVSIRRKLTKQETGYKQ
jgi:hypothetical protein